MGDSYRIKPLRGFAWAGYLMGADVLVEIITCFVAIELRISFPVSRLKSQVWRQLGSTTEEFSLSVVLENLKH